MAISHLLSFRLYFCLSLSRVHPACALVGVHEPPRVQPRLVPECLSRGLSPVAAHDVGEVRVGRRKLAHRGPDVAVTCLQHALAGLQGLLHLRRNLRYGLLRLGLGLGLLLCIVSVAKNWAVLASVFGNTFSSLAQMLLLIGLLLYCLAMLIGL